MPFWQLYYHAVWATRGRETLIDERMADVVVRAVTSTCREQGVIVHAIGTMPDHIHVVASIPPGVAVSTVVGRWKGASSHLLNHAERSEDQPPFAWQAEYGILSFGHQALKSVVAYANDQPARHAARRLWDLLEQTDDQS